jgi:hypothetical protein
VCSSDLDPRGGGFLGIALYILPGDGVGVANLRAGIDEFSNLLVGALEGESVDNLSRKERRVARLFDLSLSQHLADDDFNVLVVDVYALALIHFLQVLDKVVVNRVGTGQF